jgi:hypothetical protein
MILDKKKTKNKKDKENLRVFFIFCYLDNNLLSSIILIGYKHKMNSKIILGFTYFAIIYLSVLIMNRRKFNLQQQIMGAGLVMIALYFVDRVISRSNFGVEGFSDFLSNTSRPAVLDYKMGPYSNLELKPGTGKHSWRRDPNDKPLYTGDELKVIQGTPLPDKDFSSQLENRPEYPSVDGTCNAPKSMFVFSNNQVSPDCCPSTYTTSAGCICTTEQQRDFINNRGVVNLHKREYPDI